MYSLFSTDHSHLLLCSGRLCLLCIQIFQCPVGSQQLALQPGPETESPLYRDFPYTHPTQDTICLSPSYSLSPSLPLLRHALPLFTSLLNVVCAYDPVGYGIPYNHLLFSDQRERLVEMAMQILVVTLEHEVDPTAAGAGASLNALEGPGSPYTSEDQEVCSVGGGGGGDPLTLLIFDPNP